MDEATHTDTPPSSPRDERGAQFFDRIRHARLVRPDERRWAAGVAVGIADRLQVDPLLVRGVFVAASLFGGVGLLAYGVAWALMPQPDGRIHAQRVLSGDVTGGAVGAALAIIFGLGSNAGPFDAPGITWFDGGSVVFLVLVAAGVWWWYSQHGGRRRTDGTGSTTSAGAEAPVYGTAPVAESTPPGSPSAGGSQPSAQVRPYRAPDVDAPSHLITRATLGVALLAGAVALWARQVFDLPGTAWLLAGTVALGVIALGVIVAGVLGRRSGGLAPVGVLLTLVVVAAAAVPDGRFSAAGDVSWRPGTVAAAEGGFSHGAGNVTVDLGAAGIAAGDSDDPTRIDISLGAGQLRLRVPEGTALAVDADVAFGQITAPGTAGPDLAGIGQSERFRFGSGDPVVVVDASLGAGQIDIQPMAATGVTR